MTDLPAIRILAVDDHPLFRTGVENDEYGPVEFISGTIVCCPHAPAAPASTTPKLVLAISIDHLPLTGTRPRTSAGNR